MTRADSISSESTHSSRASLQGEKAALLQEAGQDKHYGIGIPSTVLEPPNAYKSRWRSIRIMYLTMFLSSVGFSICMSSIWPYLQHMDGTVNTTFLGWVIAGYSLGQFVASPLFGTWSNVRRSSREPLITSITLYTLASLLYGYVADLPQPRENYVLIARIAIGFGAGNAAVVRSYLSGATTLKERTGVMANVSACQSLGFIIGPGVQAALAPIGYPGPIEVVGLHFNLYTSPAFLSAAVGVFNVLLVIFAFQEYRVDDAQPKHASQDKVDNTASINNTGSYTAPSMQDKPDYVAVAFTNILFFIVLLVFSVFETIATPLAEDMFAWSSSKSTLLVGIFLAVLGLISIVIYISLKFLAQKFGERQVCVVGLLSFIVGFVVMLPWGSHTAPVPLSDVTIPANASSNISYTTTATWSNHTASSGADHTITPWINFTTSTPESTTKERIGCKYDWCTHVPRMQLWQYLLGNIINGIGYPCAFVMLFTIYSKILGPSPQGTMMGLITGSGSLARTLGPILVTNIYHHWGVRVTYLVMTGIAVIGLILALIAYRRLVPFNSRSTRMQNISNNIQGD